MTVTKSSSGERDLERAIEAARARRYSDALVIFNKVYATGKEDAPSLDKTKYVEGLSFYGLSLAMEQKKFKPAIEFCRKAVDLQFYQGEHYVNLARVYIAAGMRKKAVEALDSGAQALPGDPQIARYRREIGVRSSPAIPFLSRDNPLNIALGKARHARKLNKKK